MEAREQEVSKETGSKEQGGKYSKRLAKRNPDGKAKSKQVCLLVKKYVARKEASQQAVLHNSQACWCSGRGKVCKKTGGKQELGEPAGKQVFGDSTIIFNSHLHLINI